MELSTRYIANTTVVLTIKTNETDIAVGVSNLLGYVDIGLIDNLKGVAKELEDHNESIKQRLNKQICLY